MYFGQITLIPLIIGVSSVASAGTYRSPDDVDLPPIEQRQVVGTWLEVVGKTSCTKGIERVKAKYYRVLRCQDGSGGTTGTELTKTSSTKYRPTAGSSNGDYYVIDSGGDLGVYDNQGIIDTLPKHSKLWP